MTVGSTTNIGNLTGNFSLWWTGILSTGTLPANTSTGAAAATTACNTVRFTPRSLTCHGCGCQ